MSLRDIAKRLGVSRQAAHRRMLAMEEQGVFGNTRAVVSGHYLDVVIVSVWGRSEAIPIERALDRLGESDLTAEVQVAGGNELFISATLRNMSELNGYVEFVRRAAEIPDPTVGLPCYCDGINPESYDGYRRRERYGKLTSLDFRIIRSLQDNARKPSADIARELNVSAKTVRRHLASMLSEHSLLFVQPLDLAIGEDMLTLLNLELRPGADKVTVAKRLIAQDPIHVVYFRSFSNLPNFLFGLISSSRMTEIRTLLEDIRDDGDVLSVVPNLLYQERLYEPWDRELIINSCEDSTRSPKHPKA